MSTASRKLDVGAKVFTDFSRNITHHTIIDRSTTERTGSGISFRVTPNVPGSTGGWIDADWFEPSGAERKAP